MKKLVVAILLLTLLLVVVAASINAVLSSRSYADCASRLVAEAPPTDRTPPEAFRRLSRQYMGKRDLFLARMLARECSKEVANTPRRLGRQTVAFGTLSARIPSDQRESLAAVFLPAHGSRGLTQSAQAEWGRPPEALSDPEMTWLFVVGQQPSCSRAEVVPERDRQACAELYESLLSELRRLDPAAPGT